MKNSFVIGTVLAVASAVAWLAFESGRVPKVDVLDSFAQCLTERGFTMYGAYWCPHCQYEKAAFGDSFKYVHYVECTEEPQLCTAAGIEKFPTWLTADGRRFVGEQSIDGLAEASGCAKSGLLPLSKGEN